jgi:hypothetical protein
VFILCVPHSLGQSQLYVQIGSFLPTVRREAKRPARRHHKQSCGSYRYLLCWPANLPSGHLIRTCTCTCTFPARALLFFFGSRSCQIARPWISQCEHETAEREKSRQRNINSVYGFYSVGRTKRRITESWKIIDHFTNPNPKSISPPQSVSEEGETSQCSRLGHAPLFSCLRSSRHFCPLFHFFSKLWIRPNLRPRQLPPPLSSWFSL